MTDREIYKKVIDRYRRMTGDQCPDSNSVVIFLEKEIDKYRAEIKEFKMKIDAQEKLENRIKIVDDFSESIAEAVQELSNKHDDLTGRVEQLGDIVENKMDQVLGDTIQTLQGINAERAADGGIMTISRSTGTWETIAHCLLHNGYFVCCHFDEKTVTIEYWRA